MTTTVVKNTMFKTSYIFLQHRIYRRSFSGLGHFIAVHQEHVDDAVSPPAAAHGFDAAVMVSQSEVRLCAVVHKLPL